MNRQEQSIQALKRMTDALQLRKEGYNYDEIAVRLGYSTRSGAFRAVKRALKYTLKEPADDLRKLEISRIEELEKTLWPSATSGGLGAIDRLVKLMERKHKLLGLEAPQRLEVDYGKMTHAQLVEYVQGLLAEVGSGSGSS